MTPSFSPVAKNCRQDETRADLVHALDTGWSHRAKLNHRSRQCKPARPHNILVALCANQDFQPSIVDAVHDEILRADRFAFFTGIWKDPLLPRVFVATTLAGQPCAISRALETYG